MSFALFTEIASFTSVIIALLFTIGLLAVGFSVAPYIRRWYRDHQIEKLRTDILKLWYAFRTDPEGIESGAVRILEEGRFWIVEWYLDGKPELLSQLRNLTCIREPGARIFRWSLQIPCSVFVFTISVDRAGERERAG